jgi:ATP-dependent helicase/nuclease subunit B
LPVRIKKDGGFTAHSAVLTQEQFELLRVYLKTQLISAGNDIIDGVVDIAPLRQGSVRSCRYCPFKPVCQFDILIEGNTYRNITAAERDTIWRKLAREFEEDENV